MPNLVIIYYLSNLPQGLERHAAEHPRGWWASVLSEHPQGRVLFIRIYCTCVLHFNQLFLQRLIQILYFNNACLFLPQNTPPFRNE